MPQIKKPLPIILLSIVTSFTICFAQEYNAFIGRVNTDNINIRCDSTVSSEVICKVSRNDRLEVVLESYDWYKIRLPNYAPSFIKKDFADPIDDKAARVIKDNVNIRLRADESSPILGQAKKGELVNIVRERHEWYKIEAINNSFGWIHKKFIDKVAAVKKPDEPQLVKENFKIILPQGNIIIEGTINPKVIKRVATHKLITQDNKLFLLKGNKEKLDFFNYQKVKVTGKLITPNKQSLPMVEIEKIEALALD